MAKQNQVTQKQAAFVRSFVKHGNAAKAARDAGYAPGSARVTGCRLLTKANVRAAIAAEQRRYEVISRLSRVAVIDSLMHIIEMARAEGDASVMLSGWREVARLCGFYNQGPKAQLDAEAKAKQLFNGLELLSDAALSSIAEPHNHH